MIKRDYGLKILKKGKSETSENIDDYVYWSRYPSLLLIEKKTITITATEFGCSGSIDVPHDHEFIPLVKGTVKKTGGIPTGQNNQRYYMPAQGFAGLNCEDGTFENLIFNCDVYEDKVVVNYDATCVLMGFDMCPMSNQTFEVDLYFYLWELGSSFPFPKS